MNKSTHKSVHFKVNLCGRKLVLVFLWDLRHFCLTTLKRTKL